MTAHQVSPNPRVAFIVSKFPCYDEAFILREIYALSKTMEIAVFSLKKSKEKVLHDEARELLPQTVYVPYLFSLGILKAHFNILCKTLEKVKVGTLYWQGMLELQIRPIH